MTASILVAGAVGFATIVAIGLVETRIFPVRHENTAARMTPSPAPRAAVHHPTTGRHRR